ncbi:MAG: class II aldolase/adducin family protein [Syntrophomonadaceae bacterium]|nr:class II aldolase/adducin family protein [Syntrophomonadaceae bacterium]
MNEDSLRRETLRTARAMMEQGLVRGTWGNVSCRIPGEEGLILITPSGMEYSVLGPDDLVVIDRQGQLAAGKWKPSTESPLHAALYEARSDVGAIVHTHSVYATSFAVAGRPIPAITEEIAQVIGGPVEVAPYAACGTQELAEAAVNYLGRRGAVMLAKHGLVGVGKDLSEALLACVIAEKTAEIAVMARILGGYNELTPKEVLSLRDTYLNKYGQ